MALSPLLPAGGGHSRSNNSLGKPASSAGQAKHSQWPGRSSAYSWIGQRLHFELTPALLLSLSDFKTKTSYVFLSLKYTRHVFLIFRKIKKWARKDVFCVFSIFDETSIIL